MPPPVGGCSSRPLPHCSGRQGGLVPALHSVKMVRKRSGHLWGELRGLPRVSFFYGMDFQLATPGVATAARTTSVLKAQRFSNHTPLIVDDDFAL